MTSPTVQDITWPDGSSAPIRSDDEAYVMVNRWAGIDGTPNLDIERQVYAIEHAAVTGDLQAIESILHSHPSIVEAHLTSLDGAMRRAIIYGQDHLVAYFLSRKVPIRTKDIETAMEAKAFAVLQAYIDAGWDINQPRSKGHPPLLSLACVDIQLTEWFLTHNADPNARCKYDITPMSLAIRDASPEVIALLFDHGGSVQHGQLLHYAAWRFQPDTVDLLRLLLTKGMDVNARKFADDQAARKACNEDECGTPLAEAARSGHVPMVKFLLENGADPWLCHGTWSPYAWTVSNLQIMPFSKPYHEVMRLLKKSMYADMPEGDPTVDSSDDDTDSWPSTDSGHREEAARMDRAVGGGMMAIRDDLTLRDSKEL